MDKFIDWGWSAACGAVALVGAFIWDTRNKIERHQLHVAENYVKKDEIKQLENRIIERTDLIVDLIHAMANKRK